MCLESLKILQETHMSNVTTVDSPYLTADEAASYLRYGTTTYFLRAVKRYGIPCVKRGRRVMFTKQGLDQFMAVATEATKGPRKRTRKRAH